VKPEVERKTQKINRKWIEHKIDGEKKISGEEIPPESCATTEISKKGEKEKEEGGGALPERIGSPRAGEQVERPP